MFIITPGRIFVCHRVICFDAEAPYFVDMLESFHTYRVVNLFSSDNESVAHRVESDIGLLCSPLAAKGFNCVLYLRQI